MTKSVHTHRNNLNPKHHDGYPTRCSCARALVQLGILIENMRREGFEFCVSPPRVLTTMDEDGNQMEPIEEVGWKRDRDYLLFDIVL